MLERSRRLAVLFVAVAMVAACGTGGSTPSAASAPSAAPSQAATPSPPPSSAAPSTAPSSAATAEPSQPLALAIQEFDVEPGSHPHDVAPAPDGGVWYTGQHDGTLGYLDPDTGAIRTIPLGPGSSPHGVITGPDGNAWITDGGLDAIVRVDAETDEVTVFPLRGDRGGSNLNTATFGLDGTLWFTGQAGVYGRLDPATGTLEVFDAPEGRGPYGITTTPSGDIWYASLAGSHIARIDPETAEATVVEPPTEDQGARRIWSDSRGRLWVSEWESGQVSVHDPATGEWAAWPLPGGAPQAYAVYVDDRDVVWLTDFGSNAIVRFDPVSQTFLPMEVPSQGAAVRQLLGRPGEVWGAESARDRLVRVTETGG